MWKGTDILGHSSVSSFGRCVTFTGRMTSVYNLFEWLAESWWSELGIQSREVWSQFCATWDFSGAPGQELQGSVSSPPLPQWWTAPAWTSGWDAMCLWGVLGRTVNPGEDPQSCWEVWRHWLRGSPLDSNLLLFGPCAVTPHPSLLSQRALPWLLCAPRLTAAGRYVWLWMSPEPWQSPEETWVSLTRKAPG